VVIGEYHTLVLDGPGFVESLEIASSSPRAEGDVMYLEIRDLRRRAKPVFSI
jgi:diphthamide synthase (EF-2-diphthine--ammonia ligase)